MVVGGTRSGGPPEISMATAKQTWRPSGNDAGQNVLTVRWLHLSGTSASARPGIEAEGTPAGAGPDFSYRREQGSRE
jgi:hypothetical protein